MSTVNADPQRHLRTAEAARFLGLSDRTLEKHRSYGTGPVYRKIGGRVVYTLDDLQAWSERGARRSTTDPDAQYVSPAKRQPSGPASRPQHADRQKR
jgi:predicted DNA-binding transcriptional regulator AlpA